MEIIGIVANGPEDYLPNLKRYDEKVDVWIGADRGALQLINKDIKVKYAVGDFDSIDEKQKALITHKTKFIDEHPAEKNATDLEIAIQKAIDLNPDQIYLFGVTGGRLDHTLINIQLLSLITNEKIRSMIIDKWNILELIKSGTYSISKNYRYPYISFIPYTNYVKGISLTNFYYPLTNYNMYQGSTRCISNTLICEEGELSFDEGELLLIQSRDTT